MKTSKMIACILLMAGLFSCAQISEHSKDEKSAVADIQLYPGAETALKQEEQKPRLVQRASIMLDVTEVKNSTQKIIQLTRSVGGTVMNHRYMVNTSESVRLRQSTDSVKIVTSCKPAVDLSVRVPTDSLENFLLTIQNDNSGVAEMTYSVTDETLNYKENNLRNDLRQRYLSRRAGAKTLSDSQAVETADQAVAQIIANDRINTDVAYSSVDLKFNQSSILKKEVVANTDLTSFQLPFSVRFSEALSTGFESLMSLLIGIVQFWWVAIVGLLCWIAFRQYRGQKKSGLAIIPSADNAK